MSEARTTLTTQETFPAAQVWKFRLTDNFLAEASRP